MSLPQLPDAQQVLAWVAIAALVVSFFNATAAAGTGIAALWPHWHSWRIGHKLSLDVFPQALITHYIGNVNIGLHASINNIGGYTAAVSQIVCVLTDGGDIRQLRAHYYGPEMFSTRYLNGVFLRPDEHWEGFIQCFKTL